MKIRQRGQRLRRCAAAVLLLGMLLSAPAEAAVYKSYKKQVNALAGGISRIIKLGGSSLPSGVSVTAKDRKEWAQAESDLLNGNYTGYTYVFWKRKFQTEAAAVGYIDTLVGSKYRYLELNAGTYGVYYGCVDLGSKNRSSLQYYITNQSKMKRKLNALYKKEIAPYRSKSTALKLAIATTVVDHYYSYSTRGRTNNLAYTINTKKGVCADYVFMLDYFLRKLGMKTKIVSIELRLDDWGETGYHAVNAVKIKGKWFFLDPTNMDAGKYARVSSGYYYWFSAVLDYSNYPGWRIRSVL